ncbi:hypothetical protein WJX72_004638 [[Myrmecia] bisecta]|uniref:Thioredoxin domain-containing protein n=1 Tax=[Myrmecia] bisecta TaxID=41462 RepID=A0AAW1PX48_9CHLO
MPICHLWALAENQEEFDNLIKAAGDRLVVVDFFGASCKGCLKMEPDLNAVAATPALQKTCTFVKMRIDGQKEFARREKVKVIPYLGFYSAAAGKLAGYQTVPQRAKGLRANIQTILDNPGKHFAVDPNDFLVVSEPPSEDSNSARLMALLEMQKKKSELGAHLNKLGKKSA